MSFTRSNPAKIAGNGSFLQGLAFIPIGIRLAAMKKTPLFILLLALALPAQAAQPPSPEQAMMHVQKDAGDGTQFSHGSGVYLGGGLVLTAAHVVTVNPGHPEVKVMGREHQIIDAEVVFDGTRLEPDLDLALIRIDPSRLPVSRLAQEAVPVCPSNPLPSRPVTVAAEDRISQSSTFPQAMERRNNGADQTSGWTNILSTGYHHGASGGGVYDPASGCLEGIISLELGNAAQNIDLTVFIPASRITPFLNQYFRQTGTAR